MNDMSELKQRTIAFVGMMGVGKSHVGFKLAQKLGVEFYDSDRIIEEKAGCSVSEIFESFGEKKFRQSEKNTILELLDNPACVIATGGGSVTNPDVLDALKSGAIVIWIKSSPEAIYKRIQGSSHRPLLQNDNPLKTIEDLLNERRCLYEQAHLHIDLDEKPPHETLEAVIKSLSEFLKNDRF